MDGPRQCSVGVGALLNPAGDDCDLFWIEAAAHGHGTTFTAYVEVGIVELVEQVAASRFTWLHTQ